MVLVLYSSSTSHIIVHHSINSCYIPTNDHYIFCVDVDLQSMDAVFKLLLSCKGLDVRLCAVFVLSTSYIATQQASRNFAATLTVVADLEI